MNWKIKDKSAYKEFFNFDESEKWGEQHYLSWANSYKKVKSLSKKVLKIGLVDAPEECYSDIHTGK